MFDIPRWNSEQHLTTPGRFDRCDYLGVNMVDMGLTLLKGVVVASWVSYVYVYPL
jgi:hypothetical protein